MKNGDIVSFRSNTHNQDSWRLTLKDKGCTLTINDGRTHLVTTELTPEAMERLMGGLADMHEALERLWPSVKAVEG